MQTTDSGPRSISWYRTPLDSKTFKSLHQRSDFLGWCQTLGYLAVITLTGSVVLYSAGHWPLGATMALLMLHGTCFAFQINAVHELTHGTVFRTKSLNTFFGAVFAFLGWHNHEMFQTSHARHHRYTLHTPDDLEVVLPMHVILRQVFLFGTLSPFGLWHSIKGTLRIARGKFSGEWELRLFPEGSEERKSAIRWARIMLTGHGAIVVISLGLHLWMVPIVVTCANCYGGWLQGLCNNTQHIGLQDNVADFRLSCRTFTVNPIVQFLYWHMNYHTEHHMYAAVPCYRLGQLHRAIKHDLPPCPDGLIATWKEIAAIQKLQDADPTYQYVAPLPGAYGGAKRAELHPA